MAATCTRKKWIIGLSLGALAFLVVIALAVSVPLAAAAAAVEGAKLAVDPCAGYNCSVCACRQNGTCVPSSSSPSTPACFAGAVLPDGSNCDDGDSSTMLDTCKAGVCKGIPLSCANIDCSGPNYGFDECHGAAACELMDGATNCVPRQYEDGYDCSGGQNTPRRCWKGSCITLQSYNQNVYRDPCTHVVCPDLPASGPDSCVLNGTGVCIYNGGATPVCGYTAVEVNTPCILNGTAGLCGAFANCRITTFATSTCNNL